MEITTRRRRALSTALALFLAIESVSAVAAVAVTHPAGAGAHRPLPATAPAAALAARNGAPVPGGLAASLARTTFVSRVPDLPDTAAQGPGRTSAAPAPAPKAKVTQAATPRPKASKPKPATPKTTIAKTTTTRATTTTKTAYKGTNRFWFPALGINKAVYTFPCSRSRAPDNLVYRWGCAGANNVYLLGHAWGVFKPLHDAYVAGRLRIGMKTIYADAKGRIRTYKIKWWKLTRPTTDASWAWAAQSVPSMTLQTCVGANSEYRLMVRLVEAG